MSVFPPAWLPAVFDLTGNEPNDIVALDQIFQDAFVNKIVNYKGHPVKTRMSKNDNYPYQDGFWHSVSYRSEVNRRQRYFDTVRAPKLPWLEATILNHTCTTVKCWSFEEGDGTVQDYIWIEQHDFLVILEDRTKKNNPHYFLTTCFHVDEFKKKDLNQKFAKRLP